MLPSAVSPPLALAHIGSGLRTTWYLRGDYWRHVDRGCGAPAAASVLAGRRGARGPWNYDRGDAGVLMYPGGGGTGDTVDTWRPSPTQRATFS